VGKFCNKFSFTNHKSSTQVQLIKTSLTKNGIIKCIFSLCLYRHVLIMSVLHITVAYVVSWVQQQ